MSASNRRSSALVRGALVVAGLAALFVPTRSVAAQTVVALGGTLSFATVLPGQVPVVIAPWQSGLAGVRSPMARSAPVFQILGTPNATVRVRFPQLPASIENASGAGTVAISNYTAQFNTVNGPSGAVSFTPSSAWYPVTLSNTGKGYVSVGATVALGATQPKGAYAWGEGGQIEVAY